MDRYFAKSVLDYPKVKKAEIVTKEDNFPNLPEYRTIETFWSIKYFFTF